MWHKPDPFQCVWLLLTQWARTPLEPIKNRKINMKNILIKSNFGFKNRIMRMALLRSEPRKMNRSFGGWRVTRHAFLATVLALGWGGAVDVFSQTAPAAQSLPFNVNFGSTSFTTLPTGVAVWNGLNGGNVSSQSLAEASAPTGNGTVTAATTAQTGGGAFGYVASSDAKLYIQTSSNNGNGVNQPVVAINTTGSSGINLSYTIDILSAQPRTVGVVAQYRVGTSGGWTTLTPVSGSNPFSQAGGTAGLKTTVSVNLPSAADNQPVVQIRWAVWRGAETGNSSGLALDNISVTTAPTVAPAAPVVAAATGNTTTGFTANWAASSGATKYFLDVATDSGFTSFVTGYQNKDVGNVTSSAVTSLNAGTTYYYRVRANNSAGTSASSQPQVALTTSAAAPSITPSTASLTGLSYNGAGPSTAQSLTLSVANLTGFPGSVTISGSTNYEVSTTSSSTGFGPSATLFYSDGSTLDSSTVWVRLKAGLAAGSYNAEIIGISGGDATSSFTASGSVTVPVISVTTTNLGSFIGTNGVGSAAKTNTITGTNLAGAVTMVATNYFQLSSDAGSTYTNTLTLNPTAGALTNAVLFRIAPNAPVGNLGTNLVTISSLGAADKTVQVSGVVVYGGVTMAIAGASTATVAEGAANLTMNVTLSVAAPAGGTTVTLTTTDTDSSELGLSTSSVVFAEGETTKTVTLTPKTDSVFDTNQTIVITATAPDWSVAGTVSVTVTNTDAMPIATISLSNSGGGTYTQNFDALGTASIAGAISSTAGVQSSIGAYAGSSTLNGWYATKVGGTSSAATAITADAGGTGSGFVYSYGAASASDRALGMLASGSNWMAIGALIKNDTGSIINSITVSFTAEFWRPPNTFTSGSTATLGVKNTFVCATGKVDGSTITTANFLTVSSAIPLQELNIVGPEPVSTGAALDGNSAVNQAQFTDVVIPLVLAPGETGFVRWSDVNDAANDAGLAIDDLSLTYGVDSALTITSFVASSGPVGTQVTINGANFTSEMPVKFNGIASPLVSFVSASQIVATVPEGATTGYITVGDGAGAVVSTTAFVVGDFAVTTPLDGMDFGSVSVGSTGVDKNLVIMGAGLPGGTLNIESDSPDFLLSEDGSAWSSSLSIAYDGSFATPYIRFAPLTTGAKTGVVTLSSGGITVAKYTFTGTANSLQNVTGFAAVSGNSQISLSWTNASPSTKVIILAQQGSAVTNSPVATNSYTASTVYGSGTQVGTSYVVFNSTGTNVTVTGLTNRLLYYFKAFNVSGDNVSSGTSVSAIPYVALSNVITQWTFNSNPADASTATGTLLPSTGAGTASVIGLSTTAAYVGGSATDPLGSAGAATGGDNSALVYTGPSSGTLADKSAGVQIAVSTVGKKDIVIYWDNRASNSGPKHLRAQYTLDVTAATPAWVDYVATTDGLNVANAGLYEAQAGDTWYIQRKADFTGVSGVANNAKFGFRLVASYAPGESGYRKADGTSTSASPYFAGNFRTDMLTVTGVNGAPNSAPTQIGLSAEAIAENNAVNAEVGTLSTTDSDVGDIFTYTLVSGTGDADNASFNISGSSLRASVAFDYETKSSYSFRVRTTDSANNTFEKVFTITVTNVSDTVAEDRLNWLLESGLSPTPNLNWNSDPNNVGYTISYAYAFGLSAIVNSGAPITIVSSPAGSVKIVYMQRNSISGIIYTVKSGTDLAAGLNGTVTPVVSAVQPSPGKLGYTQYEATYTPSAPATKGFLKVEAFVP